MSDTQTGTQQKRGGLLCPHCRLDLMMTDRQGIEIDYCPSCRGVWLDRGELDKIIERSAAYEARPSAPQQSVQPDSSRPRGHHDQGQYGRRDEGDDRGHRRRRSFLGDLFD